MGGIFYICKNGGIFSNGGGIFAKNFLATLKCEYFCDFFKKGIKFSMGGGTSLVLKTGNSKILKFWVLGFWPKTLGKSFGFGQNLKTPKHRHVYTQTNLTQWDEASFNLWDPLHRVAGYIGQNYLFLWVKDAKLMVSM